MHGIPGITPHVAIRLDVLPATEKTYCLLSWTEMTGVLVITASMTVYAYTRPTLTCATVPIVQDD